MGVPPKTPSCVYTFKDQSQHTRKILSNCVFVPTPFTMAKMWKESAYVRYYLAYEEAGGMTCTVEYRPATQKNEAVIYRKEAGTGVHRVK